MELENQVEDNDFQTEENLPQPRINGCGFS